MSVVSLLPTGDTGQIILCSEWLEDHISLRLFTPQELTKSLEATVSFADLKQRANEFEIPEEEFLQETKLCLSTNNGLEGFKYSYDEDDQEFTWKKRTTGILTLVYGTAKLTPCRSSSDGLVDILTKLQTDKELLSQENSRLRKENEELQLSHQELSRAQKDTEAVLLSKCRLLINAKKEKIVELEEKLEKTKPQPTAIDSVNLKSDSETPLGMPFAAGRKRNVSNRIFSESSQPDSSDDSIPLAFLPKRKDMVVAGGSKNTKEVSTLKANRTRTENDSQDVSVVDNGQDTQDCNGIFDYL